MKAIGEVRALGQAAVVSSVIILFIVSCSSGGKAQPRYSSKFATATPNIAAAAAIERPLTDTDAKNLTLEAWQFGPGFAAYEAAQSTSSLNVADLEGNPCTADLVNALKSFHFERGYNRDWVRPAGAQSGLAAGVGSYVEIYPDAIAAHGKFAFDQADFAKPSPAGCDVQVESSATFPVDSPVGEEAFGFRRTMPNAGNTLSTYTWVEFWRGRVIASTDVIREDSRDASSDTTQFAQTLDANIVPSLTQPEPTPAF
ncbi:MAG: hypothetical protein M3P30_05380 [Chloroflexota bacterium]|nr:hypothetical protein [Chloroflexota bacterium]